MPRIMGDSKIRQHRYISVIISTRDANVFDYRDVGPQVHRERTR